MAHSLRYGIIGYGEFAERAIAPAIKASKNSSLVALQKRSLAAAREKASAMGVPLAFSSVEELVHCPDIDAVFIVSANAAHCPETLSAARAGKHVIVEKPMSLNTADAMLMIAECEEHHVALMVGHMVRLSPAVVRMRELVQSGEFGPPVFARADFSYNARLSKRAWLFDSAVAGGGPLYDIGVHCLDTLRFVLDDEIRSVKAHLIPVPSPTTTETTAHLSLIFNRDVVASMYCSYASPVSSRILEIVCQEAILTLSSFTVVREQVRLQITIGSGHSAPIVRSEEFSVPDLYEKEVSMFSDAVLHGVPPALDGANGLKNMQVLETAMRQAGAR